MDTLPPRQKAILVPSFLIWLIVTLAGIHILRQYLPPQTDFLLLFKYGVTPRDFGLASDGGEIRGLPQSTGLQNVLSLFTHMFLHADLKHLLFNSVWLATFGTPVLRRLGTFRFALIYLLGGVGGAALYIVLNPLSFPPMIGASGAISALIGAAVRFAFRPPHPAGSIASQPVQSLTNRNVLVFTAIWFLTNWLFGASNLATTLTGGQSIAWEAHAGGFIAGILLFPLIDRTRKPI